MENFLKNFDLVPLDVVMILAGALLFVVFARLFGKHVVTPFAAIVKAREQATIGAEGGAKDNLLKAQQIEEEFERAVNATRAEALQKRMEKVLAAKEQGNRTLAEAQSKAEKFTQSERETLAAREKSLRDRIGADAVPLGDMIVERVRATLMTFTLFIVCGALITPAIAQAATAHQAHGVPPFNEFLSHLVAYWGNLILYIAVVVFAFRKPIGRSFAARSMSVKEQVDKARNVALSAREALQVAEIKLRGLDVERARIRSDMERETEAEVNAILTDARERSIRIEKQARELIEAEGRQLEKRLEKDIAALALQRAEARLRSEMTPESDHKMRLASVKNVEALVN